MVKSRDARIPPRLRIAPDWRPGRDPETGALLPAGRLWDFTEKIASSRREGKNRRDGATVSTRVLRLTDELGGRLFEEAVAGETGVGGKGKKGKGKGKAAVPARLSSEEERSLSRTVREQERKRRLEGRAHL